MAAGAQHPIRFRNLVPGGPDVDETIVDRLDLAALAGATRPYVVLNMIATLDGKATIAWRTAQIGNAADRVMFHRLRAQADAVMAGAGTVRTERYGRLIRDPALRELRAARGQGDPLAVIVSASLALDTTLPLLADEQSHVVVLTNSPGELDGVAATVSYVRGEPGEPLALAPLLERLRAEHGVRTIVCEGGPTLNATLLRDGLADELFLTTAPKLAGGGAALTIVAGHELPAPVETSLRWLLETEGHLFARYAIS